MVSLFNKGVSGHCNIIKTKVSLLDKTEVIVSFFALSLVFSVVFNRNVSMTPFTAFCKIVSNICNLKDNITLFLTSHHEQRSLLSFTNVVVYIGPCVYFNRSRTAFLNSIHCHSF